MQEEEEQRFVGRLWSGFFRIAGWLIPLIVSTPSLFIWGGLMTLPLLIYIGIMFTSLFNPEVRFSGQSPSFPYFLAGFGPLLFGGPHLPDQVVSIVGILILIYSAILLRVRRREGLVASGPYSFVRHPQYLGVVLWTINLTSRSYRETLGDVGWLGPRGTLLVWFATLVAYVLLALVEELNLTGKFGEAYADYRSNTAFLIPFLVTRWRSLDIIISIVVPVLLLLALVLLDRIWYP